MVCSSLSLVIDTKQIIPFYVIYILSVSLYYYILLLLLYTLYYSNKSFISGHKSSELKKYGKVLMLYNSVFMLSTK